MEKLTKKTYPARMHYDALTKNASFKVLTLEKFLPFHRFKFDTNFKYIEEYYDTPTHLLSDSGIILSKVYTKEKKYFKIEVPKLLAQSNTERKYYVENCAKGDEPADYAISIIDSITEILGTQMHIDLVRILQIVKPKFRVEIKGRRYELLSGVGFRATLNIERISYINLETKYKVQKEGLTTDLTSDLSHLNAFINFTNVIAKHCKELVPYNEIRYNLAKKFTAAPIQNGGKE